MKLIETTSTARLQRAEEQTSFLRAALRQTAESLGVKNVERMGDAGLCFAALYRASRSTGSAG